MDDRNSRDAILPLRLIFWGGLLWIFDLAVSTTTNGRGFRFDLLNDAVGTGFIAWSVVRLRRIPVDPAYASGMTFVAVMAVIAVGKALFGHIVAPWPMPVTALLATIGLVTLVALIVFIRSMMRLCEHAGLSVAARSWKLTSLLFLFVYVVPLGLLYAATLIAVLSDETFSFDLGPAALLVVVVFVIPIVHLFVSTSRMRGALEAPPPAGSDSARPSPKR
jgi:hypothetical protein